MTQYPPSDHLARLSHKCSEHGAYATPDDLGEHDCPDCGHHHAEWGCDLSACPCGGLRTNPHWPEALDAALVALGGQRHPRAQGWYGTQGGGTKKTVRCYICEAAIDTYAAKYRRPKHVDAAIEAHRQEHLAELAQ